MGKGINSLPEKERREARLRNYIARDLGTPKYKQRIKEVKKSKLIEHIREVELDQELEEFEHNEYEDYEEDRKVERGDQRN